MNETLKSQSVIANTEPGQPIVIATRGETVMIDDAVAAYFGVTTSALNQASARNQRKFGPRHCFRLTDEEWNSLQSQTVIAKTGRGGRRNPPMAYTMIGIARLATVLQSDAALDATDLILNTFLEVRAQIAAGHKAATITHPGRLTDYRDDDDHRAQTAFRKKLAKAMNTLLDTVIDVKTGASVGETAGTMTADALENLRQRLRSRGLENEKLEAETLLILKQAELVEAQVRKSDAETKGIDLANLQTQIDLVKQIMALHHDMQPPALIGMLSQLAQPITLLRLPPPDTSKDPA